MRRSEALFLGILIAGAVAVGAAALGLELSGDPPRPPEEPRRVPSTSGPALTSRDRSSPSYARGRAQGIEQANEDIASGTPYIRRFLETDEDVDSDGLGLDRDTGLPLHNTTVWCSTDLDPVEYRAENDAYNERILAAHASGDLRRFGLGHKLRDRPSLRRSFEVERATRLADDGDAFVIDDGRYRLTYHHERGSIHDLTLTTPDHGPRRLRLWYPAPFVDRPDTLSMTPAPGPFDVLVADGRTTALIRDSDGYTWILDLPREIIIQVLGR